MNILIIVLIVLLICGLPQLQFHNYGYGPSGLLGLLLVVLVILALTGRL